MLGNPTMQRRHFELIARTISKLDDKLIRTIVAHEFGAVLGQTNPQFDRDKFIDACKLDGTEILC